MTSAPIKKASFLGFGISVFDLEELHNYILNSITTNDTCVIYGYSLGSVALVKKIPEIYLYGNLADVLLTDGRPFYYLARLSGIKLKSFISIPEFVLTVLQWANTYHWSIFLLGATDKVNKTAQEKILKKYPGISLVNGSNGYFSQQDEKDVISSIKRFSPNILLIGMTSPIKEIISIKWKSKLNTNIIIPCGGMIDVLAEKTKITPKWIKKIGLASPYRFFQEPKRLFLRYSFIYFRVFFKILPLYFWNVIIKRNKKISVIEDIKKDNFHK